MNNEFTIDEIRDAIKTARIYCPGFDEQRFQNLMELEKRIAEPGYLEAVQGMIRLEKERNISCIEALDAFEDLLKQKAKLEGDLPELEKSAESLIGEIKQAVEEHERATRATAAAARKLARIEGKCAAAEKKLKSLNRKLEKDTQRVSEEIEGCYRQVSVTKEEVLAAGQVKNEAKNGGFTLDLVLGLSRELAGHKDARSELAEGLKEHGSLKKYLNELSEWGKKEKERVLAEISGLESDKKRLTEGSAYLKNMVSKLQADVASEEELRRFYHRYLGASPLMEHLASWNRLFFIRCTNPLYVLTGALNSKTGNAHLWTDKEPAMCPHCGHRNLVYDDQVYQALNLPVGASAKVILG